MTYINSVAKAIKSLNNNAKINVKKDDDIDNCTISWLEGTPEISKTDIKTKMDELQAEYNAQDYARKRKAEYPDIYDYMDGIVKNDQTQIDKYIADAQDVKARHPKGG